MTLPLAGLRVLDFGQGVAGPYCGQILADHGADVIKVEPPRGDWSRTMGAQNASGMSGTFVSVNHGKRSICLDMKNERAVQIARALAERADVLIESFRPEVMARFGLDHPTLARVNRGLVYCSVTGFGPDGPNAELPAGDSIMQAYGALMSTIGELDGEPLRVGNMVSDMLAGTNAFSGVVLALLGRHLSGIGKRVQVSLLDSIVAFQAPPLTEFLMTRKLPRRLGNRHPLIAPSGAVRVSDGSISYTVFDHQWHTFCEGMGVAEIIDDARFRDSGSRQRNRDVLDELLAPIFVTRTSAQWIATLRAIDVLCSPINDFAALELDPQVRHNHLIDEVRSDAGAQMPWIRNPVRLEGAEERMLPAPRLGEHSRAVLMTELSYEARRVDELIAQGAIAAGTESETGR
jgi:crotonobetainyl-CoA:carnitine CoA-transferase CaiB-like acyl-CoA transferase